MKRGLDPRGDLGSHHFSAVDPATIDNKSSVAYRMDRSPFLVRGVDVSRNSLKHDDVVPCDDVDDLAFDVGETLLDQRRLDDFGGYSREPELDELVRVGTRAGPDPDHPMEHEQRGLSHEECGKSSSFDRRCRVR